MSSFICPKCGLTNIDTLHGYTQSCTCHLRSNVQKKVNKRNKCTLPKNVCPDCNGVGIYNDGDYYYSYTCQTCDGYGSITTQKEERWVPKKAKKK
jgi:DnaJ-class molecular chaperone